MKFLADENLHGGIVQWLRDQGHDVLWASESFLGKPDQVLLAAAEKQERTIITSDLDFGELVFNQGLNSHGVLLLRLEKLPLTRRIARLQKAWSVITANPLGYFLVVTPQKVRVRSLASGS